MGKMELLLDAPRYKENLSLLIYDSMILFEYLIMDEQTQICGFSALEDLSEYSISLVWRVTKNPELKKLNKISAQLQNLLPLRWGNMFVIDVPWYFNIVWVIVKQFMSKKIASRLNFMKSSNMDVIYEKDFNRSFLPRQFGGTLEYDFGEEFLKLRVEEEGNAYTPAGRFVQGGEGADGDANSSSSCTPEELVQFRALLCNPGLQVYKKDRLGRKATRVLYSPDGGATLCFAEKFGGAQTNKRFPVNEITDVRRAVIGTLKGKKEIPDAFEIVHPSRTLQISVGTMENRELLVKRVRGMVVEAAMRAEDFGSGNSMLPV